MQLAAAAFAIARSPTANAATLSDDLTVPPKQAADALLDRWRSSSRHNRTLCAQKGAIRPS